MPLQLVEADQCELFSHLTYGTLFRIGDVLYIKCYWPKGEDAAVQVSTGTITDVQKEAKCYVFPKGTKLEVQ